MSLFLNASAMVAILAREPESYTFARRVEWDSDRITSAIAIWEATRGLANARGIKVSESRAVVADYIRDFSIRVVPISDREAELALDAHERYGKGVHPAGLNLGDCFAYACVKHHNAVMLFKGDDFTLTDVRDGTLE